MTPIPRGCVAGERCNKGGLMPREKRPVRSRNVARDMRLDKFLKLYRIIKRRTGAHEACEGGYVSVNGHTAKPGKELRENDEVIVDFREAGKITRVRIKKLATGNVVSPDDVEITEEVARPDVK